MPDFAHTVQQTSPGVFTNCCCLMAPLVINAWVAGANGRPVHAYGGRMRFTDSFSNINTDYATAVAAMAASSPATGIYAGRYSTTYVTFHNVVNQTFDRFPSGATYANNTQTMILRHAYEFPTVISAALNTGGGFYCNPLQTAGATVGDGHTYLLSDAQNGGVVPYVVKLIPYVNVNTQVQYISVNNCTNYPASNNGTGNFPVAVGSYLALINAERLLSLPDNTWHYVTGTAKQLCSLVYVGNVPYQQPLGPVLLPSDPNYNNAAFWQAAYNAAVTAGTLLPGGYFTSGINSPVVVSEWAEK